MNYSETKSEEIGAQFSLSKLEKFKLKKEIDSIIRDVRHKIAENINSELDDCFHFDVINVAHNIIMNTKMD